MYTIYLRSLAPLYTSPTPVLTANKMSAPILEFLPLTLMLFLLPSTFSSTTNIHNNRLHIMTITDPWMMLLSPLLDSE